MAEKILSSTHILMLPFTFSGEVKAVNRALCKKGDWDYHTFDVGESHENYNEYIYFYEHVRKTLYGLKSLNETQASYYFEHKKQRGTLDVVVGEKTYVLDIVGISMRTFETSVAILTIELENTLYGEPKDVLSINDFVRRLYPQFLTEKTDTQSRLDVVKGALLPHSVSMTLEGEASVKEDFSYYEKKENLSHDVTHLPAYIHTLLGSAFSSHCDDVSCIHIEPVVDDRMFLLSLYGSDALSEKMKIYDESISSYAYEEDDFWYKYVFVDGTDKTCQSRHMQRKLIKETTYDRWVEWGTLYGVSRYSFVALSSQWFAQNRLEPHMRTMYFQMFSLLLAYRSSVLQFSKRVSDITLQDKENFDLASLQKSVSSLYKDYINFQNNLLFREVTAQEQGIELYAQALKVMQIDEQVKNLDSEIAELHTYVSMKVEEKDQQDAQQREERLEKISELGAVFLPPSLLAGIYGVNIFHFPQSYSSLAIGLGAMGLTAFIGFLGIKKKISLSIASVLMVGVMGASIYLIDQSSTSKPILKKEQHVKVKV